MYRPSQPRPERCRAWAAGALLAVASIAWGSPQVQADDPPIGPPPRPDSSSTSGPHRLDNDVADLMVHVRGGAVCTGTPIAETRYVVTAAHCVLDLDGNPGARTVVRGADQYDAVAVLVDTTYFDHPSARLDAAVLVLDRPLPGPAAGLGDQLPADGTLTVAGYQPLDSDGTLLRGTNPDNRPLPTDSTGSVIVIQAAPAGCVVRAADIRESSESVSVPCGLIPGASGGGLYATTPDGITLLGIVSTVSHDLTHNGIVPLTSLRDLLTHTDTYRYDIGEASHVGSHAHLHQS